MLRTNITIGHLLRRVPKQQQHLAHLETCIFLGIDGDYAYGYSHSYGLIVLGSPRERHVISKHGDSNAE